MCRAEHDGFVCTLYPPHGPMHEAWDIDRVLCASWPVSDPEEA